MLHQDGNKCFTNFCCSEADLRIGELQWGDSGVYVCKVVSIDDLEGRNEGQVELLVLGELHPPQHKLERRMHI